MEKLGINKGSYGGEMINIREVLREIETAAKSHGWTSEVFHELDDFKLTALHRPPAPVSQLPTPDSQLPAPKIYISAGIHGDEPAGPLAMLRLLQENRWPGNAEYFLLPCLNPIGFTLNRRENATGIDLNRDYRNSQTAEAMAHITWLQRQPRFDLYLCLHEDWEAHGFYLYEQNPDNRPSLAETIISAVRKVCPVDESDVIEGRAARGGVIRPIFQPHERPDWPEAFYLISHKSRLGYTLEAPSDFTSSTRVSALAAAVNAALEFATTDEHR